MDWVETTGKSIDEAIQKALAHLGVAVADAEVEVLEEPTTGLFGRVRGEARVRAKVKPSGPRPKRTRRNGPRTDAKRSDGRRRESSPTRASTDETTGPGRVPTNAPSNNRSQNRGPTKPKEQPREQQNDKENTMAEGISLAEQAAIGKEFLEGLLRSMNLTAEVTHREIDETTVELSVNADPPTELGVLVGPRGTTLQALQEVTRTVVQSKCAVRTDRILVDVAHYRERRVAALGRFAGQVAEEVTSTGEERALEPMSAADRKAVHDALTENEKIVTRSEGEEPRRFVVVAPA